MVTFLPFGDWGCNEQGHNKVMSGFIKKSSLLDRERSRSAPGLHPPHVARLWAAVGGGGTEGGRNRKGVTSFDEELRKFA